MNSEWMSGPEVAAMKGVSREAVAKAIRNERLPATRIGNRYAVKRSDAEAWQPVMGRGRKKKD